MSSHDIGPLVSTESTYEVTRPLVYSCVSFIVIDTVIVLAKSYSRHQLAKLPFWWDDAWIILAWVFLMPVCALGIAMADVETSWTDEDRIITSLDEAEILLKMIYAILPCLLASFAATRYSILALYLRIFSEKRLRIAIWILTGFVTVQCLAFTLQGLFQCQPVQHYWNRRIEGSCVDVDKFYRAVTPFNIFVDLMVILLPLPPIWNLKATNTRKWALSFLFGVGIAALIASAYRLYVYSTHTAKHLAPSYTNIMVMWLVIEPSIHLIAACLPAMHHIFVTMVPTSIRMWVRVYCHTTRLGSTILRRSNKGGNMSLSSDLGDPMRDSDERHLTLELGNAPGKPAAQSSAHARRGENASVDRGMLDQGIVVTTEVLVTWTEEERIQRIIGF